MNKIYNTIKNNLEGIRLILLVFSFVLTLFIWFSDIPQLIKIVTIMTMGILVFISDLNEQGAFLK